MLRKNLWLLLIFLLSLNNTTYTKDTIKPTFHKSSISTRNLIKSANYDFNNNRILSKSFSTIPDSLKLLAIRVEFQEDTDRNTTGNGKFDLSHSSEYLINPPPHDLTYFENQLLALADYFYKVSNHKLVLTGEVYPKISDQAYLLPQKMSYYNPNTTEDELDQRLAELFRDSFIAAESSDSIDFSSYDCFIVFHAGVGAEFTFEWDTTPNDIPSVFLNFQDLKSTIGKNDPNFEGIEVTNNIIHDGIILPETESQMEYDIGLLGTAAIMFGHQLGLPNLYNSDDGHPGIGVFGLMDQGSANFSGLLPAQPCAWSKVFLGWEEPIEISSGIYQVAAALASNQNNIYKIPINSKEYFLLENRLRHVLTDRNTTTGWDANGLRLEFKDDGRITPPDENDTINVIIKVDEYDFGLPGSGILIWHIDESVIEANYKDNRVNTDMYHRGVDLEEADGAQDIGHFYNFFGITGYESGSEWDMWWDNNEAYFYANDTEAVSFAPNSMPDSRAYSGANSHIVVKNFSKNGSSMEFTLTIDTYQDNFPQPTATDLGWNSVVLGDIDGINGHEIIAASINGKIFAWHADGSKVIDNVDSLSIIKLNGDTLKLPQALFAEIGDFVLHTPALANLDADNVMEVIVTSNNGRIYAFKARDENQDGRADTLFTFDTGLEITTVPVILDLEESAIVVGHQNGVITAIEFNRKMIWQEKIADDRITGLARYSHTKADSLIAISENGDIYLIDQYGDIQWQKKIEADYMRYPAIGDINYDGRLEILVCGRNSRLTGFDKWGNHLAGFNNTYHLTECSNPTVADLDHDGYLETIVVGDGYIYAYHYNGTLVDNFPIMIDREQTLRTYPDPIIANLDNNLDAEIIVAMDNQILAFNHNGTKVAGFPLSVGGNITSTPSLSDIDGNGQINLSVAVRDSHVYVWNLGLSYAEDKIFWGTYLHDVQHTGLLSQISKIPPTNRELMPPSSVYNWPNPTEGNSTTLRYWLNETADVNIRVYDMAGDLVRELNGTGFGNTANEIQLSLDGIQSGVYLTRVEAKSPNQKSVSFFKMAIVK